MDATTIEYFRERLEDLKDQLLGRGRFKIDPNAQTDGKRDDDSQPLNEMHQSIASTRNRNRDEVLELIENALDLIREDPEEFGLCEACGCDIPRGRLELMPYAPMCVRCQGAQEGDGKSRGRKKLTDYR